MIGLVGGKGAGKDTAARYLTERYGAQQYAFADAIKSCAMAAFGLTHDQLHGSRHQKETIDPRYQLSPRQLMQRLGDGARAAFGDDFWITRLLGRLELEHPTLAVISDVRLLREASRLRTIGCVLWRLHYAPGLEPSFDPHATEAEWDLPAVDLEIHPAYCLGELYAALDQSCRHLGVVPRDATSF